MCSSSISGQTAGWEMVWVFLMLFMTARMRNRKPIHAELKKLKNGWTNKRDKYEEAHRAELTLWNAASRYLHANLTDIKMLPISEWKQEYADLKEQRDTDYTKLKFADV